MKLCVVGDIHLSTYSSILRGRGKKYSTRLEQIIGSINWAENVAKAQGCGEIIYLGDFFDTPHLNCEEITALKEIKWADNVKHSFIVGNHESNVNGLYFNSTNVLNRPDFTIYDKPYRKEINNLHVYYIPYMIEEDRIDLSKIITSQDTENNIVFSHNDIKGFNFGGFISEEGYSIPDIESKCKFYFNGHLHNGAWVTKKILDVGNLTGQNFSEDASRYEHHIVIFDTDTGEVEFVLNPCAANFYKLEIKIPNDLDKLNYLKTNAVVSVRCHESLIDKCEQRIKENTNIIEHRIISYIDEVKKQKLDESVELRGEDHLQQFNSFIIKTLGDHKVVKEELEKVTN